MGNIEDWKVHIAILHKESNSMISEKINQIKKLVLEKKHNEIRELLNNAQAKYKGQLLEETLEYLYKGNGWLVRINGSRSDAGADLLLFHPETPDRVSFIIQAKNHKTPLTVDDTRIELIKFEEQAQPIHQSNQYKLISLNGFVENALKLEQFGMGLYNWDEIVKLINNYNEKATYPSLELTAHNSFTHKKINKLFESSNRVAVIQATGTGKSYLIGQSLIDHINKNSLVLAPSIHILTQQKKLLPWLPNVTYMTYAKAANVSTDEWTHMNVEFIVMDEFHRAGALKWGQAVKKLTELDKRTKVLGTTATHIRFLDSSRNMATELFNNVIANNLPLQDAIAKRILPSPKYVSALYQLKDTINDRKLFFANKRAKECIKKDSITELDKLLVNWESSSGVPEVFNKHLETISGKYVVFCEDLDHLDLMSEQVRSWFRVAANKRDLNVRRYDYVVHSKLPEYEIKKELESFKHANNSKGVHLLFSVNMLNEGLHIKGVNGVILLRKTTSPIIYFQQIGRCLQAGDNEAPVIFDLVNNINNIKAKAFSSSIRGAITKEQNKREKIGLPKQKIELHIVDETIKISNKLKKINKSFHEKVDDFEKGFIELKKYKKQYGDCLVDHEQENQSTLYLNKWVSKQQLMYIKEQLSQEKIEKLNNLDFVWHKAEYHWELGVKALMEYKSFYGKYQGIGESCISPSRFDLATWAKICKRYYYSKKMPVHRLNQLLEIGFIKQ